MYFNANKDTLSVTFHLRLSQINKSLIWRSDGEGSRDADLQIHILVESIWSRNAYLGPICFEAFKKFLVSKSPNPLQHSKLKFWPSKKCPKFKIPLKHLTK